MTSRTAVWSARLQNALPLLIVYFALAALYAWQASRRPVPTIFIDELELTLLSRSIAETGEATRRGEPFGASLLAYLLAPVWWLGSASTAYATAKLLLVLAMTATIFPAYALARLVVPRWYAIGAAGAAVAVPALAYSPILVEEPAAYPLSTLTLWLIARTLVAPGWRALVPAVLAAGAATLVRAQLAVLFVVLALGLLWLGWRSDRVQRWRSTWGIWDWIGAVTVSLGIVFVLSAAMGHASLSWRNTTGFYKERLVEHATWAVGALAIGIGFLPLVIGASALVRPKGEPRDPRMRGFLVTSVAAIAVFVWYAAVKGAHISATFSTIVVERNMIYLIPVLFAATALAFARGVGRGWAIGVAAVVTLVTIVFVPLRLDAFPYYEAHGLMIGHFFNRELRWSETTIQILFIVVCLLAVGVAIALGRLARDSTASKAIAAVAAAVVVVWGLTGEVYAASAERDLSTQIDGNLAQPYDWVERVTKGESVVVIGQGIQDPTGIWLTEFFNPSIRKIWSLDGSAAAVGAPILTPDLEKTNGVLTPNPETEYALALNGVQLAAPEVARRGNDILYRVGGEQLRLASAVTGLSTDGWITGSAEDKVGRAAYTRYDVSRDGSGFAVVKLSRVAFCSTRDVPSRARVRIGTIGIGSDNQPTIGRLLGEKTKTLNQCIAKGFVFPAPRVPWRVEIRISPTFAPNDIDSNNSDRRQLAATLDANFQQLGG